MTNPITPPPELIDQWWNEAHQNAKYDEPIGSLVATKAAQWGADMELEACCKWLPKLPPWSADDLRRHRRPKPPSLKARLREAIQREELDTALRLVEGLNDSL